VKGALAMRILTATMATAMSAANPSAIGRVKYRLF
jgi:hypothetical protein